VLGQAAFVRRAVQGAQQHQPIAVPGGAQPGDGGVVAVPAGQGGELRVGERVRRHPGPFSPVRADRRRGASTSARTRFRMCRISAMRSGQ